MMERRVLGGRVPIIIPLIAGLLTLLVLLLIILNLGAIVNAIGDVLEFIFDPASRDIDPIPCDESSGCRVLWPIIFSALLLAVVVTGFAYTTLLERKLVAWFQNRVGPNRVGPGGFLQPAADGLKLIFKEDIMPSQPASRPVYLISPMLKAIPTLVVLAVIPLGPPIALPWFDGNWYRVALQVFDTNVAVLWLLAITSLGTYGVVLAGWSSNNKYAMLGGLRASAQMVSYELSMGLGLAVPVMIAASMSLLDITEAQGGLFINWFVFQNPLAAAILMVALIAETNRAPFDLPEAEQELTAGYMTEYSGMKFALFMMAEYLGMIAVSLIAAVTFFGGYQDGFGLVDSIPILGPLVILGKVILLLMGFVWIRATLPRIRYDRLMMFGWKVMLPLAFLAVVWTAIAVVVGEEIGGRAYIIISGVMFALFAVGGLFFLSDGRTLPDTEEDAVAADYVVTGERNTIGWSILQVIGGLIAIPMLAYNFTLKALDSLAQLAPPEDDEESAILDREDANSKALPPESAGD